MTDWREQYYIEQTRANRARAIQEAEANISALNALAREPGEGFATERDLGRIMRALNTIADILAGSDPEDICDESAMIERIREMVLELGWGLVGVPEREETDEEIETEIERMREIVGKTGREVRELDDPEALWCGCCGQRAQGMSLDFGIGAYEYWGAKGYDRNICWVSECCETTLYSDPMQRNEAEEPEYDPY